MKTAVIISNWNGEGLLRKNLPIVLKAGFDEIVVVDDYSTDGSVEYIKNQILNIKNTNKNLKLVINDKNKGFPYTVNRGVRSSSADVVFLLNTDVVPKGDIIRSVTKHFSNPKVFGVSLNEGKFGWAKPKIENGFLGHEPGGLSMKPHNTFWVSGGSGAFRKSMWDKLGGLDTIYSPFYWEDVDLSFRALKRGWKLIWEPEAVVEHEHEATINTKYFSRRYLDLIKERNQLIFHWKNLSLGWLLTSHLWGVLRRMHNPGYFIVVLLALMKLHLVLWRRLQSRGVATVSCRQVLRSFGVNL